VRYLMAMALFLTYIGLKNLVLDLILALQTLPTARLLPSPNNRGTLFGDLSRFNAVVDSDDFDIKSVVPLLEQVIKRAPDKDIWSAVISLVSLRATPPSISNKAALDTPLKSTSSSQQGSEQIHDEIDQRILQEINGCVYQNTRGFYEKYFEGRSWSPAVEKIVRAANPRTVAGLIIQIHHLRKPFWSGSGLFRIGSFKEHVAPTIHLTARH